VLGRGLFLPQTTAVMAFDENRVTAKLPLAVGESTCNSPVFHLISKVKDWSEWVLIFFSFFLLFFAKA
jgi:hypothetical protein